MNEPPPGRSGLITLSHHDYGVELARDVARGLQADPKSLPSKYFYDERGGELFSRITDLPEYYLTRAEMGLLEQFAADIMRAANPGELLELGSGSADKTALLLEAAGHHRVAAYAGLDVNEAALAAAGRALRQRYPGTRVTGFVGDFVADLDRVPPSQRRRLVLFFGSTIGNLTEPQRARFLASVARLMGPEDTFLLGVDLVKDVPSMVAAYDDSRGVTAEFTRNVLRVVNRELGADFDVEAFRHEPVWNAEALRMEAWLRATRAMEVRVDALDLRVRIEAGEAIHTEVSCKFTRTMIGAEFAAAGLELERWLSDPAATFALALARRAG